MQRIIDESGTPVEEPRGLKLGKEASRLPDNCVRDINNTLSGCRMLNKPTNGNNGDINVKTGPVSNRSSSGSSSSVIIGNIKY